MTKLQKKNGHLVSPRDNKLVCTQENYPKEANDVRFEYSTLFPFTTNPNVSTAGLDRRRKSLDRGRSRQTISTHLPYRWQQGNLRPQPQEAIGPRFELCFDPNLDSVPVPKDCLSQMSTDSYRRPRPFLSLPPGNQKAG